MIPPDAQIREVHRRAVAWAFPLETWGEFEREHEDEVVTIVQASLRGERERPWLHSHHETEAGMCHECDAAYVIRRLEEE